MNAGLRTWKIVSGGQTGVDRAGLAAAMDVGIPFGGWVPKGRIAEDGVVPEEFYAMREYSKSGYKARTRANIVDSDATLILADMVPLNGGTALTERIAVELGRPCKVINLKAANPASQIRNWMLSLEKTVRPGTTEPIVLNVAGPRESKSPGIFGRAKAVLTEAFGYIQSNGADYRYDLVANEDPESMAAESPVRYDAG